MANLDSTPFTLTGVTEHEKFCLVGEVLIMSRVLPDVPGVDLD